MVVVRLVDPIVVDPGMGHQHGGGGLVVGHGGSSGDGGGGCMGWSEEWFQSARCSFDMSVPGKKNGKARL